MEPEIVVSLITLFGSALGAFGGILVNSKLTAYRIEQLEKKQDKHNAAYEALDPPDPDTVYMILEEGTT